ncbi:MULTISPECIES: DUF3833 family protein [Pseudophaeobacter]|uniref:DUF3833 family protein n=1 Tax=Pseudophaeobacter TaxID=1541822 RepID=UPI00242DA0A6|nr:DUF3833 family protein [Pseudophaeobacter profundi]
MKILTTILVLVLLIIMARDRFFSFRAQNPADYKDSGPSFVLQEHLSGRLQSEGLIFGPKGDMTNSFVAEMVGEWDGDTGTLTENFTYSNGKTQQRKWYLRMDSASTFTATADDIVGEGKGVISGSTVKLSYLITLPEESGGYTLEATDWMYLTENGVIMNKSEMRKYGIKVAELLATMHR